MGSLLRAHLWRTQAVHKESEGKGNSNKCDEKEGEGNLSPFKGDSSRCKVYILDGPFTLETVNMDEFL